MASWSTPRADTSTGPTWEIRPADDGSIERGTSTGGNRTTIVPEGGTFTPKQLQLEEASQKLYWCDREGMRVMRCNLDGSNVETLVQTGEGDEDRRDQTRWCVGIAVDPDRGQFYWTQKGPTMPDLGRSCRAGTEMPDWAKLPADRNDIEVLYRRVCPSRSTSSSTSQPAPCTGPTAAIRREATPSTGRRWIAPDRAPASRPRS